MITFPTELSYPYRVDTVNADSIGILTCQYNDGSTVMNCITGATGEAFDSANQIGSSGLSATWVGGVPLSVSADPLSILEKEFVSADSYYLKNSSESQRVTFDSGLITGDFEIEFQCAVNDIVRNTFFVSSTNWQDSGGFGLYYRVSGSGYMLQPYFSSANKQASGTWSFNWGLGQFATFRLVRVGSTCTMYVDGIEKPSFQASEAIKVNQFFYQSGYSSGRRSFKYLKVIDRENSANSRFWIFNQSSGTTVTDELNGEIATLYNFPTDNSQWEADVERYSFTEADYPTIPAFNSGESSGSGVKELTVESPIDGGALGSFSDGFILTGFGGQITSPLTVSSTGESFINDLVLDDVDASNATTLILNDCEAKNVTG